RRADRGGQRLQVVSLADGAFPPAIVEANDGHCMWPERPSRRLDVEVEEVGAEGLERPPLVSGGQLAGEVAMTAGAQRLLRPFDLVLHALREPRSDAGRPSP